MNGKISLVLWLSTPFCVCVYHIFFIHRMASLEATVWSGAISEKGARGRDVKVIKDIIITQCSESDLFSFGEGQRFKKRSI